MTASWILRKYKRWPISRYHDLAVRLARDFRVGWCVVPEAPAPTHAGVEPLALQSLGKLGNDRVYAKFAQREEVQGLPTTGKPGFYKILDAVAVLESAGFGFGKQGSKPGQAYEYADVSSRTPTVEGVNTLTIR